MVASFQPKILLWFLSFSFYFWSWSKTYTHISNSGKWNQKCIGIKEKQKNKQINIVDEKQKWHNSKYHFGRYSFIRFNRMTNISQWIIRISINWTHFYRWRLKKERNPKSKTGKTYKGNKIVQMFDYLLQKDRTIIPFHSFRLI